MSEPAPKPRIPVGGYLAVAAFAFLVGAPSLLWVMGRDQGIYAYTAWAWLRGDTLYSDVFVFKQPATVFYHAASQILFGPEMDSIRIFDWLLQAATAVGLAWVVAWWSDRPRAGVFAGMLYVCAYYEFGYWDTAQTDGWFIPHIVLGLYALGRSGPSARPLPWAVLGGFALGSAAVLKVTALALVLPGLVVVLAHQRFDGHDRGPLVAFLSSFVAPSVLTVLWLVARGAWADFVHCQSLVASYATHAPEVTWGETFGTLAFGIPPLAFARPMIVGVLAMPRMWADGEPRYRTGVVLWAALMAACLASLVAQGRYHPYHALPLLAPLAWTGGLALALLTEGLTRFQLLAGGLLIFWIQFPVARDLSRALEAPFADREASWRRAYYPRAGRYRSDGYKAFLDVAAYVKENSEPDEDVFVWGYDPVILFLAQRHQTSRYLYTFPMIVAWQDGTDREELLGVLAEDPPHLFVVSYGDPTPLVTLNSRGSALNFLAFEELSTFVREHYEKQSSIYGFQIFHFVR